MRRSICKHRCIIFFIFRCCFIRYSRINMCNGIKADHDAGNRGTSECIMQALDRCKSNSERRCRCIEKTATCIALHYCDSYSILLTDSVKFSPFRSYAANILTIGCFLEIDIQILCRWKHIKSRIDTEENHLNHPAFCRKTCNCRVMSTHAYMPYDSLFF